MDNENPLTRRTLLKMGALGAAGLAAARSGEAAAGGAAKKASPIALPSKHFYTGGAFDGKKALRAYFDMMDRFGYPIPEVLKTDQLWTCDFLQADFSTLGMAGIFWINEKGVYGKSGAANYSGDFKDQAYGYLGHEIYLLPGQMVPEHSHIGGPEGYGPKMEAWQVRYGEAEFFGEYKGAGDETLIRDLPAKDRPWGYGQDWFKSKYVATRTAKTAQLYVQSDPESWHFVRAGAEGAIISEYATYHNHVRFTKPGMAFDNTKPKP